MRRGSCPRCNGTEIYAARNALGLGEGGYHVAVRQHIDPGFRGIRGQTTTSELWQFTCAGCGLVEMYIIDDQATDFIRGNWVRVPPPTSA